MESRQARISDPNFVRLSMSNLDKLCGDSNSSPAPHPAAQKPQGSGTPYGAGGAAGGFDASALLSYFYEEQLPVEPISSQVHNTSQTESVTTRAIEQRHLAFLTAPIEEQQSAGGISLALASEMLGLDRRSVLGLIKLGILTAESDSRGQVLIDSNSLRAYSQQNSGKSMGTGTLSELHPKLKDRAPEPEPETCRSPVVEIPPADCVVEVEEAGEHKRINAIELVSKLQEAQSQLESASYRIGFLEAELASSEHKIKLMPDLQGQESRLAELERENFELHQRLERLERGPLGLLTQFVTAFLNELGWRTKSLRSRSQPDREQQQIYYRRTRKEFY